MMKHQSVAAAVVAAGAPNYSSNQDKGPCIAGPFSFRLTAGFRPRCPLGSIPTQKKRRKRQPLPPLPNNLAVEGLAPLKDGRSLLHESHNAFLEITTTPALALQMRFGL